MKKSLVLAAIGSMVMTGSVATAQKCAHDELIHAAINSSPAKKAAYEQYERELNARVQAFEQEQIANGGSSKTTASKYVIPVVFHVMLTQAQIDEIGGVSGVYARIQTQMGVLNTDYNALNTETIPTAFASLKGNPDITFGLAHTAPNGKGTVGYEILVKPSTFTGFNVGDGDAKKTSQGGLDPWDNKKYLNIWIFNITGASSGKVLGYAYNPALASAMGDANLMGVCVDYQAYGKRTSSFQTFYASADRGRTMVHELGHYFTLNHIWGNSPVGSGVCTDDDGVGDTPVQSDANQSTCPTFPKASCTSSTPGEMFMNYMDYVNDACMSMFSKGQVTRMQADLVGSGGSATLPNNSNLLSWPTGVEATEMQQNLSIVPNPSNGLFTIAYHDYIKNITIVNMLGQPVKQFAGNDQQSGAISVDLTGMSKGIYTVQCQYMEGIVSRKIVIE